MTDPLCSRCQSLDLSVAKFRFEKNRAGEGSRPHLLHGLTSRRYELGTMTQLKDSAEKCKLCALIVDTVRGVTIPHMDDKACHLLWEMDGRTSADPQAGHTVNTTRRLRVCWEGEKLKSYEAHIMLAAPPKYDNSDVDYPNLLNKETQFLGRRIGSNHNKRNLIREFLRLCERHHDDRCTKRLGIENPFRDTLKEPYFGVIDIENECLVPLPYHEKGSSFSFEPYATVSYVWGSGQSRQHATRKSTIQSRRKSGGLSAVIRQLPKALRESIDLIRGMSIRYIWIDAMCIVQDSSHSWNLNARAMHLIYGNSTITICAADGQNATTGLVALDESRRPPQMVVNYAEGVCLMLHRPAETSIEATQWNKRAWTFQERLLSKRCLIFTEGKIFFQCRSTGMSEDVFSDQNGKGWSLDLVRAPLQLLSQLKVRAMWFYAHCVALYTRRDLYEPFDILAAFGGMCKLMEYTMQAPLVFGLPTSHFDLALLWQPTGKSLRLERAAASDDPQYKDMRFPSWSWCGWNHQGAAYDREMVDGCFADVRAWILGHTWIDWHIRDGYGTLRRVWDVRFAKEDESEDDRWRGYQPVQKAGQEAEAVEPEHGESDITSDDTSTTTSGSTDDFTIADWYRPSFRVRKLSNTFHTNQSGRSRVTFLDEESTPPKATNTDNFGRPYIQASVAHKKTKVPVGQSPRFTLTLPEDPYNVLTTETTQESLSPRSVEEFPDQPFLQFFTWRTDFYLTRCAAQSHADHGQSPNGLENAATEPTEPLRRCDITDHRGDKCGSVFVDTEWLRAKEDNHEMVFQFIAISDAKEFTKEEFPDWTYYIPRDRIESEWDLYYVLLVESYPEEGIYRRVALGKVFKAAFIHSEDEWKEIILG